MRPADDADAPFGGRGIAGGGDTVLPMSRLRPPIADVVIAAALAAVAAVEVGASGGSARAFGAVAAITVPLAWRRSFPLAAAVVVLTALAAASGGSGNVDQYLFATAAVLFAAYSLAAHAEERAAAAGLVACLALAAASVAATDGGPSDYAFAGILLAAPWTVGLLARRRLERATAAEEQMRTIVADERARIARELHDVVAHAVGVMVIQAGAAEAVVRSDPAAAQEALAAIRATGKQALSDLRRMLGLLRESDEALTPQPQLADVAELVERVRQAGLPVELELDGDPTRLPPAIALTAFRVAQEALTNALKHAPGAATRLAVHVGDRAVVIEAVNAAANGTASAAGSEHGLVGMRERVELYRGRLEARPERDGGFRVRATIPLE